MSGPRVVAGDKLHREHQTECIELCRRHDMNERCVNWVEHDVIDLPLLRFGCYSYDADGNLYLLDDDETLATYTVERPLLGQLPPWWPALPTDRSSQ